MKEVHSLRENDQLLQQIGTSWEQSDINISSAIKADPDFREKVLGDKYRLRGFNLKVTTECEKVRIILYRHKRTNGALSLTGFTYPFNAIYDASPLKAVYYDKVHFLDMNNKPGNSNNMMITNIKKAINFVNVINSDNGDYQETSPLRLLILRKGQVGDDTTYSWEALYQNI